MSLKKLVSSSICTVVLCGAVSAQESSPKQGALPPQSNANQGITKQDSSKQMTHAWVTPQQIATCLALDNQVEVILSKFAQEKSKNEEVVSFAKMIAEEHQSCLKKLSKFAPEASREGYLNDKHAEHSNTRTDAGQAPGTANSNTNKDRNPNQSNASTGTQTAGIDMMQLHREVAQQCIADSKQYLSKKEGAEFDKCFVGMQIAKHAAMHTKLVVLQRHTTDEMQQLVSEGIQATAKHMKAAESLMTKLDSDNSEKLSSKSGK